MGAGGGGVAALAVMLAVQFCCVTLPPESGRLVDGGEEHVGCPANLLHRQHFAAGDQRGRRESLTNSGAEQSTEDRDVQMPMDAAPAAALEVVPAAGIMSLSQALPKCAIFFEGGAIVPGWTNPAQAGTSPAASKSKVPARKAKTAPKVKSAKP